MSRDSAATGRPRHVIHLSGGITSWFAGDRVASRVGRDNVTLLFADTLVEDNDVYRFLIQGSALILGVPLEQVAGLAANAMALPDLGPGSDDERDAAVAARALALASLRADAMAVLPSLVWLADGRTPWQVFRDVRFIGNTRVDPCSSVLKRDLLDAWVRAHTDDAQTIHYLGLDWTPKDAGRQPRFAARVPTRRVAFPAAEEPHLLKREMIAECEYRGAIAPDAYAEGFAHANCGRFCTKAGQREAQRLYVSRPGYFLFNEQEEERTRRMLGKDVAVLRDRRGRVTRPLPLAQFRARLEQTGEFDVTDRGACNCFEADGEVAHVA